MPVAIFSACLLLLVYFANTQACIRQIYKSNSASVPSSIAIVRNRPAIAYYSTTCYYVRSGDWIGHSWTTPPIPLSFGLNGDLVMNIVMKIVLDRPAIVISTATKGIRYKRALDAEGTSWGEYSLVQMGGSAKKEASLIVTTLGKPIVFFEQNGVVLARSAATALGGPWDVITGFGYTIIVSPPGNRGAFSAAVVDGHPAVLYIDRDIKLRYARSLNAEGTQWPAPNESVELAWNPIGFTDPVLVAANGAGTIGYFAFVLKLGALHNDNHIMYWAKTNAENGVGVISHGVEPVSTQIVDFDAAHMYGHRVQLLYSLRPLDHDTWPYEVWSAKVEFFNNMTLVENMSVLTTTTEDDIGRFPSVVVNERFETFYSFYNLAASSAKTDATQFDSTSLFFAYAPNPITVEVPAACVMSPTEAPTAAPSMAPRTSPPTLQPTEAPSAGAIEFSPPTLVLADTIESTTHSMSVMDTSSSVAPNSDAVSTTSLAAAPSTTSSSTSTSSTESVSTTASPVNNDPRDEYPLVTILGGVGAVIALIICVNIVVCMWCIRRKNVSADVSVPASVSTMSSRRSQRAGGTILSRNSQYRSRGSRHSTSGSMKSRRSRRRSQNVGAGLRELGFGASDFAGSTPTLGGSIYSRMPAKFESTANQEYSEIVMGDAGELKRHGPSTPYTVMPSLESSYVALNLPNEDARYNSVPQNNSTYVSVPIPNN